ncbi:MAG: formylglycine-generating enzyme family protein [Myxococcota bacterium]|nr:formylglycine-generating enzyme family protein [Myxococcota bacterium]
MRHSLPLVLGLIVFGTIVPDGASASCPTGQVQNALTDGRCCWVGQTWSKDEARCVGLAQCPKGLRPSTDGEHCVDAQAACDDGQRRMGDGCCWPGQTWQSDDKHCLGAPECPTGFAERRGRCVKLPPRAPGKKRPYVSPGADTFVTVKPGAFTQGSDRRERGRFRNERPYTVALSRFLLVKKTEVTQGEWLQLVGHNPAYFKRCGSACPVERVNWYEVLYWLNLLSEKEGLNPCYRLTECRGELGGGCRAAGGQPDTCAGDYVCKDVKFAGPNCAGYRLPTESEWEYFARAGTVDMTYAGRLNGLRSHVAEVLSPIAWYQDNSQVLRGDGLPCQSGQGRGGQAGPPMVCGTHPVSQKKPNPWGIYDTIGNVAEWIWDGFGTYPVRSKLNPIRDIGLERGVRGGSWQDEALRVRVALRSRLGPRGRNARIGFRYVRTIPPDTAKKMQSKPSKKTGIPRASRPKRIHIDPAQKNEPPPPPVPVGQPIKVAP